MRPVSADRSASSRSFLLHQSRCAQAIVVDPFDTVSSLYRQFTGEAGMVVIFGNNLIHRDWPAAQGHREVVVFMVLLSKLPWREHVARMGNNLSLNNRAYQTPVDQAND